MSEIDRRTFIKGAGVATGVAATGAGASRLDLAPVQQAEAIPPLVIGAGVAAGGVALGWALREFEVIGADDPPEGLTADALHQSVYQTIRTRKSTNASTFVDNRNIIDGLSNTLYVEGKLAMIEALNAEKSQSNTQSDGIAAVEAYAATIEANLLKTFREAAYELENVISRYSSHSDASITWTEDSGNVPSDPPTVSVTRAGSGSAVGTTITLSDGSTMDIPYITQQVHGFSNSSPCHWNPVNLDDYDYPTNDSRPQFLNYKSPAGSVSYMNYQTWQAIWGEIQTVVTNVKNGLITWLDSVYGQVQSGDISVSDLITPRERAAMMTDDGKYPQAVADLLALNVPVDFEREATVALDWHDDDVTLNGTLAITSPPDNLTPGTYDPQADSLGSVYLTYDVGAAEGVWTAYDDAKGVDGGTVEFESEPYEGVTYDIVTNYDETASVTAGDFTEGTDGSSNTVWTADVSGQLDNSIAEISEVTYYTDTDETRYETIQMEGTFTIEKFTNTETGEQADSASFSSSEPQTDDNYVTQEEWNQLQQQNEELIEKYEDSQSGGGGLFPDAPDIPGWGIVVAVGGIALVLLGQSDDNGY